MRSLIQSVPSQQTPESLARRLELEPGLVVLRTGMFEVPSARYSFVTARPILRFRSSGSRCETLQLGTESEVQFGNPWALLNALVARFELLDEESLPFPLGGIFGFWGYDLKHFVEPRLSRHTVHDLELPDCNVGFYASLVVFDHLENSVFIVSTGLEANGERSQSRADTDLDWWKHQLLSEPSSLPFTLSTPFISHCGSSLQSSFPKHQFLQAVKQAQDWIRSGDIYQVNLAQRLDAEWAFGGLDLFEQLCRISPSPFAAFIAADEFSICSSSPELFLRLSGRHAVTRPIKGTRPRHSDPTLDAALTQELITSEKERAELVMITDLLRNDLGRVSEFGSVNVPHLAHLERFAQVQHLVSTIQSTIRAHLTHLDVLESCFPGGSITGAPKIRAMEIIDLLEPVARGPYTGCIGYLGFNRESQLSIAIRTVVIKDGRAWFHVGAGIVSDSIASAEYQETWSKAGGIVSALGITELDRQTAINRY